MNSTNIRNVLCNDIESFEYLMHPVAGNIIIQDIQNSPTMFWEIFSSIPVEVYISNGDKLFLILDSINWNVEFLLSVARRTSIASLPILFWIVRKLRELCDEKNLQVIYETLKSKSINESALALMDFYKNRT